MDGEELPVEVMGVFAFHRRATRLFLNPMEMFLLFPGTLSFVMGAFISVMVVILCLMVSMEMGMP